MKNLPPNLTFESLNDLLNGLKDLLPIGIRYRLIILFEKKFPNLKATQPDLWTPEIFKNQNSIIEELLTQVSNDEGEKPEYRFTFRNQFFITFSDPINENSKKKMKHLIPFDTYISSGNFGTKNRNILFTK